MSVVLTPFLARVLAALQTGLPLEPRPYAALAARMGCSEDALLDGIRRLDALGVLKRFGCVVRHRELGYRANAMAVFEVAPAQAPVLGRQLAKQPGVTLCYRRATAPEWPYNLYAMFHGCDRATVLQRIAAARTVAGLTGRPYRVLFSTRRFKQCGGCYGKHMHGHSSLRHTPAKTRQPAVAL